MRRAIGMSAVVVGALVLTGMAPSADADPAVHTIRATDYEFEAPAEVEAGAVTFRFVVDARELHHAVLVGLPEGRTVDDLREAMIAQEAHAPVMPELPAWATYMGGPNPPPPGGESRVTMPLRAGDYAWICLVHSPDGEPHYEKGMITAMRVTPGPRPELPDADLLMRLSDHDFELSEELTPGTHTIRVGNYASQPHEVILFKLAPGKTPDDFMAWMGAMMNPEVAPPQGPPPAMPMGGVAPLGQGRANNMTVEITPGNYLLLCVLPDAGDGRLHVDHGMVKLITVADSR